MFYAQDTHFSIVQGRKQKWEKCGAHSAEKIWKHLYSAGQIHENVNSQEGHLGAETSKMNDSHCVELIDLVSL